MTTCRLRIRTRPWRVPTPLERRVTALADRYRIESELGSGLSSRTRSGLTASFARSRRRRTLVIPLSCRMLNRALEARDVDLLQVLNAMPALYPFRHGARYRDLMARMGMPERLRR